MEHIIKIPLCRQATNYTCGPAALQSILGYYNCEYQEDVLSKELHCVNPTGTDFRWILRFCNTHHFVASFYENIALSTVLTYIDQNIPVLLLIQCWTNSPNQFPSYSTNIHDSNHYVVACGYTNTSVIFMDPSTLGHYTYLRKDELMNRWHLQDEYGVYQNSAILITPTTPTVPYDESILYYLG